MLVNGSCRMVPRERYLQEDHQSSILETQNPMVKAEVKAVL